MERIGNILLAAAVIGIIVPFAAGYLVTDTSKFITHIPWISFSALCSVLGLILLLRAGVVKKQRFSLSTIFLLLTVVAFLIGVIVHVKWPTYGRITLGIAFLFLITWLLFPSKKRNSDHQ
jgi:peptidoglycan/LPS O-acetylase OafA/YrhL